jgi:hypothetical protein
MNNFIIPVVSYPGIIPFFGDFAFLRAGFCNPITSLPHGYSVCRASSVAADFLVFSGVP